LFGSITSLFWFGVLFLLLLLFFIIVFVVLFLLLLHLIKLLLTWSRIEGLKHHWVEGLGRGTTETTFVRRLLYLFFLLFLFLFIFFFFYSLGYFSVLLKVIKFRQFAPLAIVFETYCLFTEAALRFCFLLYLILMRVLFFLLFFVLLFLFMIGYLFTISARL
jgi:hypothetical protein